MAKRSKICFLSGNMLKFIAAFTMVIDHLGFFIFKDVLIFRIIGRITFPIFSYLIAEGCRYTKNKIVYISMVGGLAFVCQLAYAIFSGSYNMCVLVTFFLSIMMVYALENFKVSIFSKYSWLYRILSGILFVLTVALTYLLNEFFVIEYGFFGCLLPVFVSLCHTPKVKNPPRAFKYIDTIPSQVVMVAIALIFVTITGRLGWDIQIYCFLSLPFLFLYSGKRGRLRTKYFFYIFYPAHLVVLEGIAILIELIS